MNNPLDENWIYCADGNNMPPEHDTIFAPYKGTDKWNKSMFEKMSDEVLTTVEHEDGRRRVVTLHTVDGVWSTKLKIGPLKVISWQPFPKAYEGDRNV